MFVKNITHVDQKGVESRAKLARKGWRQTPLMLVRATLTNLSVLLLPMTEYNT